MKAKHAAQFNQMHAALKRIAANYQTPDQLRRSSEKQFGIPYSEAIEYAYENIQAEAAQAIKGVRKVAAPTAQEPKHE